MSVRARPLAPVTAIVVVLALISWLIYCLHFNFDVTDEGLYLYSATPHPHFPSANYYFQWVLPLTAWLDGGLLTLRYAALGALILAAAVVFREYRGLNPDFLPAGRTIVGYALFLLAGLSVYSIGLSSWSYNTVVFLSVALLFAAVIRRVRTESVDIVTAVHLGVSTALAWSARLSSGLLFSLIGALVLFVPPLRVTMSRRAALAAVAAAVGIGATSLVLSGNPLYRAHFTEVLLLISQSSHAGLLANYLGNISRFILERMLIPGILWWLARRAFRTAPRERVDRRFHGLYLLAGTVLVMPFDPVPGCLMVLGQMLLLALFIAIRRREFVRENLAECGVAVTGAGLALVAAVGTNNNLVEMSVMYAMFLLPLALVVTRYIGRRDYSPILLAYLAVFAGSVIYHKQYRQYYRSPERAGTRYVPSSAPHLSGVWIPAALDTLLTNVAEALRAQGFSRDRDAVLAYHDVPGIGAALGLPMFGSPWLHTGYDGIDAFNCYVVRNDRHPYRYVYMVLASPFTDELRRCVEERLVPAQATRVIDVGGLFHYWANRRVRLTVVGPFQVRAARAD